MPKRIASAKRTLRRVFEVLLRELEKLAIIGGGGLR
jgi:hypothetical protein